MGAIIISDVKSLLDMGYSREWLIGEFVRINQTIWGDSIPPEYIWTPDKVQSQFARCPNLQYCAIADDACVATLTMMLATRAVAEDCRSWIQISSSGMLDLHNPDGDSVFGIDLTAVPGFNLTGQLMDTAFEQAIVRGNKRGAYLGSRAPSLSRLSEDTDVEAHIAGKNGRSKDPEVRMYQRQGFRIVKVIPGYMTDPKSRDYGVLMFWENPYYE